MAPVSEPDSLSPDADGQYMPVWITAQSLQALSSGSLVPAANPKPWDSDTDFCVILGLLNTASCNIVPVGWDLIVKREPWEAE